jgi:hypothetical protein
MRYLLKRNDFLIERTINKNQLDLKKDFKSSSLINETFENDLSWGGSLIGRLINSTLRVLKIYTKTVRVNFIIPQFKKALDDLLTVCRTNEEQRAQLNNLTGQFLLEEIIKVVNSDDSVEQKVAQLLGADNDANPGLVRATIMKIEKIEGFTDKDEVITKLEAFLEALRKLKEELGDLPETDEDDEEGDDEEGEGEEGGEGDKEDEISGKSLSSIVRLNLFIMFRSIRIVFDTLKLKKVSLEGENKKTIIPKVGKEYTYTDKSGRKLQVKVIDIKNQRQPGKDGEFLTGDDIVDPKKKISPKVLIAQKNKKGVYGSGSIITVVEPGVLSESLVNEEFVGTGRGRGEGADSAIKPGDPKKVIPGDPKSLKEYEKGENRASSAFKKVRGTFESNEQLLKEGLSAMTQIQNDVKSDENVKGYLISIMKEVIANESTVGKPMTFKELTFDKIMDSYSIKEAVSVLKTKYAPIVKSISVVARVFLAFKEDKGLLGALGELKKPILDFIEAYDLAKENLTKIGEKKVEKEKKEGEEGKEKKSQNESFRLFEAADDEEDENTPDEEDEFDDDLGEGTEGEGGGDDKVKSAWREQFTEEEEKKYKVNDKDAKELQNAVNGDTAATIDVTDAEQYDRILEIVKIFGKAYKMYAVDDIPSGRPEGRISQKTFREYEYIGKENSTRPEWKEDSSPGYGPWAARVTYEKWQDGVMDILQDTKYRKILANSTFKNAGPNQEEGSGLTLFTFINDMLNEGGDYGTFRQRRHALLNKYFVGNAGKIEEEGGDANPNESPRIPNRELGTPGEVNFLQTKRSFKVSDFKKGKNSYLSTFFKVKGKGAEKKNYIIFVNGHPLPSDVGGKNVIAIKLQISDASKVKESLITSYLSDKLTGDDALKLGKDITNNPNEPIYAGVIEFEKNDSTIFEKGKKMTIKFIKSDLFTTQDPTVREITVLDVGLLQYVDQKTKKMVPLIKTGAPKSRLPNDRVAKLIDQLKQDKIKKKFGLVKK